MAHNITVAAVVMEKGSVGKTTVALNLAVAALQDGRNAVIIDIDPRRLLRIGQIAARLTSRGSCRRSPPDSRMPSSRRNTKASTSL